MDHPKNYDDPFDSLVSISIDDLRDSFEENMNRHLLELFYFSIPPKGMQKKKPRPYRQTKNAISNSDSGNIFRNPLLNGR